MEDIYEIIPHKELNDLKQELNDLKAKLNELKNPEKKIELNDELLEIKTALKELIEIFKLASEEKDDETIKKIESLKSDQDLLFEKIDTTIENTKIIARGMVYIINLFKEFENKINVKIQTISQVPNINNIPNLPQPNFQGNMNNNINSLTNQRR